MNLLGVQISIYVIGVGILGLLFAFIEWLGKPSHKELPSEAKDRLEFAKKAAWISIAILVIGFVAMLFGY